MKKTKKRWTRLLAICVCMIIVLSACASVDAPSDNSTATEESKATSALELSEVNAESTSTEAEPSDESSQTEPSTPEGHISADAESSLSGDITITPIEPTYPEERETTLEKVLSFDIGIDGMFQYNFVFHDNPSSAMMARPGDIYTDGRGTFYHTIGSELVRLNDGAWILLENGDNITDVSIVDKELYILRHDKSVEVYDISVYGAPVLKNEHFLPEDCKTWVSFYSRGNSQPIILTGENKILTYSGTLLNEKNVPFVYQAELNRGQTLTVQNGVFFVPSAENNRYYVCGLSETDIWLKSSSTGNRVYTKFDQGGNPNARILVGDWYADEKARIDLEFEHAGEIYTKDYYTPRYVAIDKTVFDDLFDAWVFFDSYGTMYFAAYYTDHCDIYRVDAGYTSAEVEDHYISAETSDISPTSSTTETTSSVQWIELTKGYRTCL